MTLGQLKKETLILIEEYTAKTDTDSKPIYTEDEDLRQKLNIAVNSVQTELATKRNNNGDIFAPILKVVTVTKESEDDLSYDLPDDFFQLDEVRECRYEVHGNTIDFNNKYIGTIKLRYYAYPTRIDDTTLDTVNLEIDRSAQEIMKYGVASELLKADISSNYSVYENRYLELKSTLETSRTKGIMQVVDLEPSKRFF
jgi:hypothetical protein